MRNVLAVLASLLLSGCNEPVAELSAKASDVVAAAPGRVEGASETYRIGTSAQAPVARLLVSAGDRVSKGQPLIELDCADITAQAASLEAQVQAAEARQQKLQEGYRKEEIAEAIAQSEGAGAELERARAEALRVRRLRVKKMASKAELDTVVRDERTAAAQKAATEARAQMLRSGSRHEDILEAEANAVALNKTLLSTRKRLSLCVVTAPVKGKVLRIHVTEGELVSPFNPMPLVSFADLSRMRVRAEVDERDVGLVEVGQKARVMADAYPDRTYSAVVEEISHIMGRKRILTTDPAEKSDRDVMEVILGLQETPKLPVGLRVTVQFLK